MKKYIIEGVGTFFLTLIYILTGSPFAVGAIIAVLIYVGSPISGGHYNPAVTAAMWFLGKMDKNQAINYFLVQCAGSLCAAMCFRLYMGDFYEIIPPMGVSILKISIAESLMTFFFVFVVLSIVVSKLANVGHLFGFIIGTAFSILVFFGGTYNPAISVGTSLAAIGSGFAAMKFMPVYVIGSLSGGFIAAYLYKLFYRK